MLDGDERTAILELAAAGHGAREIARALGVSRNAVRRVLQVDKLLCLRSNDPRNSASTSHWCRSCTSAAKEILHG